MFYENNFESLEITAFEEKMEKQLLIEALTQQKAEVFENVIFDGTRRYYIEDLTSRDYVLEGTTPYQMKIYDIFIEEKSWGALICKVLEILLEKNSKYLYKICDFRCPWSKAIMISKKPKTNFKKLTQNLYVNCNHTALHSCWFIQDLLDYFNVDKASVYFLIHRPSGAEPKEVKEYIEKRTKRRFSYYLQERFKKDENRANKIINNIDKYLNRILRNQSRSHVNFFLFDDKNILYNYIQKVRNIIDIESKYDERTKKILNKYLDYILTFYRKK